MGKRPSSPSRITDCERCARSEGKQLLAHLQQRCQLPGLGSATQQGSWDLPAAMLTVPSRVTLTILPYTEFLLGGQREIVDDWVVARTAPWLLLHLPACGGARPAGRLLAPSPVWRVCVNVILSTDVIQSAHLALKRRTAGCK